MTRWCRKGAISTTALGDDLYWHTFSRELFFADRSPSSSTGVVYSMHIFTNVPVGNLNVYFSTLNASSLQGAPTYPLLQVFAVLWRKKERLRQWRMLWSNFSQGLTQPWKKHCFCMDSCQKQPSKVTSSSVTPKDVLTHRWDGVQYDIIGLSFRNCWRWRFCAFQSHAISNYSSGKQDSINVQSEYSYLNL